MLTKHGKLAQVPNERKSANLKENTHDFSVEQILMIMNLLQKVTDELMLE